MSGFEPQQAMGCVIDLVPITASIPPASTGGGPAQQAEQAEQAPHYQVLLRDKQRQLGGILLGELWRCYAPREREPRYWAGRQLQDWIRRRSGVEGCEGSLEECRAILDAAASASRPLAPATI